MVPGVVISMVLVVKNITTPMMPPTIPAFGFHKPNNSSAPPIHSVSPIISAPTYGPNNLNSQPINGLLLTSGVIPSAPADVILKAPAQKSITTIPNVITINGTFRSATHAANLVNGELFIFRYFRVELIPQN